MWRMKAAFIHIQATFPDDIRFVTHLLKPVRLQKNARVTVGLRMHTPPVFAKIKKFSLVVI